MMIRAKTILNWKLVPGIQANHQGRGTKTVPAAGGHCPPRERKKRRLRERVFAVEDEAAEKRDRLVETLEKRLQQKTESTPLVTIRCKVV